MMKCVKILLVDDDQDDRDFFSKAAKKLIPSIIINEACDGEMAMNILTSERHNVPDYIFLDLNMPRMDGRAVLGKLKNDHELKKIPVIILSTSSDPKDKEDTLLLGANSFITKPYELKEWDFQIQNALTNICPSE